MAMMFLLIGGQNARNFFSAYVPAHYLDLIEQKKWMVGIATFFVGNQLQNMITSTGAFEVFVNGNLVRNYITHAQIHSKLKSGVVPILGDLEKMIIGLGYNLIPKF